MARRIEMKSRKAGKGGVITMLKSAIAEGQTVIVAKIDERTQIVSLEPYERVQEIAESILEPKASRHSALLEKLNGLRHREGRLSRVASSPELDRPISSHEAAVFMQPQQTRRRLSTAPRSR